MRSWCLIFWKIFLGIYSAETRGTEQQGREIDTEQSGNHIRIISDGLMYHISGDKHGTDVVAHGKQDVSFAAANLFPVKKLRYNVAAQWESKEKSRKNRIDTVGRNRNQLFEKRIQYTAEKIQIIGGYQYIGDNGKRQQSRKNPLIPQQETVSDAFHTMYRVYEHKA